METIAAAIYIAIALVLVGALLHIDDKRAASGGGDTPAIVLGLAAIVWPFTLLVTIGWALSDKLYPNKE